MDLQRPVVATCASGITSSYWENIPSTMGFAPSTSGRLDGGMFASPAMRVLALTTVADGRCSSTLHHDRVEHSISRDRTFGEDTVDRERIAATLYYLIERCCKTLRKRELCAQTVTVKVRSSRFLTLQKQLTLRVPTANEEEIFAVTRPLLERLMPSRERVRLVGVKASHLVPGEGEGSQMELAAAEREKRGALHQRVMRQVAPIFLPSA